MMTKLSLLFLLVLYSISTYSQVELKFSVTDEHQNPVDEAHISVNNYTFKTNDKGEVKKVVGSEKRFKISISHVSYTTFDTIIELRNRMMIKLNITLKGIVLSIHTIESDPDPDTVYGNNDVYIEDFAIIKDKVVLISYEKKIKNGVKISLLNNGKEEFSWQTHLALTSIEKAFDDQWYVFGEDTVLSLNVVDNKLLLLPFDKKVYDEELALMSDKIQDDILWSNYRWDYPAFTYFMYQQMLQENSVLYEVNDTFQMDMLRASYKYLSFRERLNAFKKEIETGIDKEIIGGFRSGYQRTMFYEEPYAPLFVVEDSIYLFDFTKSKMLTFDKFFNKRVENEIIFQNEKHYGKWQKSMFLDSKTKKLYAQFKSDNFDHLWEVNLYTSTLIRRTNLTYQFVEKIQLYNGWAYYLYRPFGSSQRKFLYKERLN